MDKKNQAAAAELPSDQELAETITGMVERGGPKRRPAPKPATPGTGSSRYPTYTVKLPDAGHKALAAVTKDGDAVIVIRQASSDDLVEYVPKVLATLLERMSALEDKE